VDGLQVILVVGVNGVGKTTSIAKLAAFYKERGRSVVIAAADTFRAAAGEQIAIWSARVGVPVIGASQAGGDPGAVVFDAVGAAKARRADILIVDTAGRLHTKFNLMEELKKIRRVAEKAVPGAPHQVLLVIDATTGQNGLNQARQFTATVPVTGIILTKLDGTAKGGIVFAICKELGIPIQYVGTGEHLDDFAEFDPEEFVTALLA
jgi:fused signal recognition particle receptor